MASDINPRQPYNNLAPFRMQQTSVPNPPIIVPQVVTQEIVFADGSVQTTAGGGSLPTDIDLGTF